MSVLTQHREGVVCNVFTRKENLMLKALVINEYKKSKENQMLKQKDL